MSKELSIDERMKEFYEKRNRRFLTRRTPVIIRIDGKAFHTYTRGLKKPFDGPLMQDMQNTLLYLCENIQGVKFGYHQSDEISLLLTDFDTTQTAAWFDYCQNKMESVAASMATSRFNQLRTLRTVMGGFKPELLDTDVKTGRLELHEQIEKMRPAEFDARAFNIPVEDVENYFWWRQVDASKNSISMLAQSLYSHSELQGKNGKVMQEMSFAKGINWNDLSTAEKRGSACYKVCAKKDLTGKVLLETMRNNPNAWFTEVNDEVVQYGIYTNAWKVDGDTPIFKADGWIRKFFTE